MPQPSVRERLTEVAFALFDERGYEQTTVDDIAVRAGVGRTTVFRSFQSKDDLIFPDHDSILAAIRLRLADSTHDTLMIAVREATELVLARYLDEGERAKSRYRLTSTVPALRIREVSSVQRYQRVFRDAIAGYLGTEPDGALRAELLAAGVVTAHNYVLRQWLRGEVSEPRAALAAAMDRVLGTASAGGANPGPEAAGLAVDDSATGGAGAVVLLSTSADLGSLLPSLQRLLAEHDHSG